ncbi:MAG: hypothetical protein JW943_12635 [Deltaproteobacteria bacterium]|nr:hypothetical protein [Deltaproteobacteria bacterium]
MLLSKSAIRRRDGFRARTALGFHLDACKIYDGFTHTVEITLQHYEFFKPGEGRAWLRDGAIEQGGMKQGFCFR